MAGTVSPLAWVLVGLLVVPIAALGADTVQRGMEAETFPTAPLHAHERFVYDVTLLSDFQRIRTTAHEHLDILVSDTGIAPDSNLFGIQVTRQAAPWDAHAREVWEPAKHLADARFHSATTEYIDPDAGRLAHRTSAQTEEQWYTQTAQPTGDLGAAYRYVSQAESKAKDPGIGSMALAIAGEADATWSHQVPMLGLGTQSTHDRHALPLMGTYNERTVYGRNETTSQAFPSGGAPFGCDMESPPVSYQDRETAARHAHSALVVTTTRAEWRDPALALPVVVDCHRSYLDDDGKDIGHLRILATLTRHQAGDQAHTVAWDDTPAVRPDGPLQPRRTVAPGVPADAALEDDEFGVLDQGDGEQLRLPIGSAHPVARVFIADHAPEFAAAGDRSYGLVAARYWPNTETAAPVCQNAPDLLAEQCDLLPPTLQEPPQAFVEPHWYLTYENIAGERMTVQVLRNMTTTGQVIEDVATMVREPFPAAGEPLFERLPVELVPVHDMLVEWLHEVDLTIETWRNQEQATLGYHLEPDPFDPDAAMLPVYTFRSSDATVTEDETSSARGPGAVYAHESTQECRYDAKSGALFEKRLLENRIEDDSLPEASAAPAAFTVPTEQPYNPVAALVVGVVGLGAVAATATPTGRGWIRGILLLPFFTKLNREQVLEHRTRDAMVAFVKANPGVGTEEIRRQLGIGWGTAVYHLSALEQNGLVSSMRRGGNRHWFPVGLARGLDREALAILRGAAASRLHEAIRSAPGRTQQELAAELGVTHGAVIFQVRKLERVGLVRKQRDGRFVRYFAASGDERVDEAPAS